MNALLPPPFGLKPLPRESPPKRRIRLLILEDTPEDAELVIYELKRCGFDPDCRRVETEAEFAAHLSPSLDAILSDYHLPEFDALRALRLVRESGFDTPFIILSGAIGEDVAVAALKLGADDYLLKDRLSRLGAAVSQALEKRKFRDEQKRSELQLRASEQRFVKAFHASPVGICITSLADGRFIDVNDAFLKMFGFQREDVLGRLSSELDLWPDHDERRKWQEAVDQRRVVVNIEQAFRRRNGALGFALASFDFMDLGGEECVLALFQDITERRILQEQLRQAQKMEAIGQLAGGVAHDFNNLLTIIQGYAQMLLAETARNGEQWEPLAEILAASDRASCLTRQLLAFSRKQVMQARSLDVSEVVTGAGKLLQRAIGEDIAFFADCMPGIPPVFADAGMIEQVLMNLALNARDAMPDGGRLVIGAWKVSVNEAMARERPRRRAGEFVCLQVSDTGCGMTAEVAGRIFEPFFTTKSPGKGTGLGLATVYNIVQMHHGWIEVESKAGLGTVFKVFLPRAEAPVDCGTKSQQELAAEGGPETVFLVEDEPGVRHLASSILRRRGYKVIEAASGIAALSIWPQHGKEVDIILTDIVMPDGVSGPELAKRLRGLKPELEVVFTSGYCAEALTGGVELQEGVNFLKKPYLPGQLAKIVRAVLDKRNAKVSSE